MVPGLCNMAAGIAGGFPHTTSSSAVGLTSATGVTSRSVAVVLGMLLVGLAPPQLGLLALNFSKRALGVPGARVGIDGTGRSYARFGLPGTALFYRAQLHHERARAEAHHGFISALP
jgi:uncharacterized protein DUF4236/permease family protein